MLNPSVPAAARLRRWRQSNLVFTGVDKTVGSGSLHATGAGGAEASGCLSSPLPSGASFS